MDNAQLYMCFCIGGCHSSAEGYSVGRHGSDLPGGDSSGEDNAQQHRYIRHLHADLLSTRIHLPRGSEPAEDLL